MKDLTLYFDTETSGLPNFKVHNSDPSQPWVVQLAAVLCDGENPVMSMNLLCKSEGLPMSKEAQDAHGISVEMADVYGYSPGYVFNLFHSMCTRATKLIAHNLSFDMKLITILAGRLDELSGGQSKQMLDEIKDITTHCTMMTTTNIVCAPYPSGRKGNKWPKLEELYFFLFNENLIGAHDALVDVMATRKCHLALTERGLYK